MDSLSDQMIDLLNYSYKLVLKLLEEQGEFFPIGIYINQHGSLKQRLEFEADEFPLSDVLIRQIQDDFGRKLLLGEIIAYSIVYNASITNKKYKEPIDVAIAKFESKNADSPKACFLPYKIVNGVVQCFEPWLE